MTEYNLNPFSILGNLHNSLSPHLRTTYDSMKQLENHYLPSFKGAIDKLMSLGGIIERSDNPTAKFCFYTAFVFATHFMHVAFKKLIIGDPIAYIAPAVIGAIMQGRPDCPAQVRIEEKPTVAALAGSLNGIMCCVGYSACLSQAPNNIYFAAAATVLFVAIASKSMCAIESKIGDLLLNSTSEKVNPCCACKAA